MTLGAEVTRSLPLEGDVLLGFPQLYYPQIIIIYNNVSVDVERRSGSGRLEKS